MIVLLGAIGGVSVTWACRLVDGVGVGDGVRFGGLCRLLTVTIFAYVEFRYWPPLVMPVMGGLLTTHFCLLGYLVIFEQAERRRVRSVFNKVMAPDVVVELLKTDKLSSLNGARRKVTVFFSDIRGFTEMTDVKPRPSGGLHQANTISPATQAREGGF